MKLSRRFLLPALLSLAATTSLLARPASATSVEGAVKLIEDLGERAIATLQDDSMNVSQREAAFGKILREGFDLNLIGRFVIGKYWRQANDEQRSDYLEAFSQYVIKTYARRLGGFQGQAFSVTGTKVTGEKKDVLVATAINRPSGPPIKAGWRVREIKGKLRIIDVIVAGVSMAVTQRQEFASVTRTQGIEGLVQVLRAQTERLSATAG